MKIKLLVSATMLALCGFASAQSVVEITDPAKIAEIEAHAKQLGSQPMAQGGEQMDGMHHGDRMHRKHMRQHRRHMQHKMNAAAADMKPAPDAAAAPAPKN